ncbi:MAG TPA: bifunctional hydroxymethylpyrimidine kinase/phosphomethylpyrimidine kinase, partial [Solirubrobacteraceae bacterium]|nr:bifunctional hydroxymethylpyrimidine kinase/phosphomethylpyrimidine kinase [Solirubrobacteraceae bacterium]
MKRVLTIAGSDSGGGAGIQGDLKALARCGVYAMTAVTAVTAQNTLGVAAVHQVPAAIVRAQIDAVLGDIGADAIKIGMLGDAETVRTVADRLAAVSVPIVLDPLLVASSGEELLAGDARELLVELLVPLAAVVTPNLPEARALAGAPDGDGESLARAVLALGAGAVVLTGGHRGAPVDLFCDARSSVE